MSTHNIVVLAAHGRSTALALTNTNDGDGRAVKADKGIDIGSNVDQIEDCGQDSSCIGLLELREK